MKEFVAHWHPLLVHLPIGILMLAVIFVWMGQLKRYAAILDSLPVLLRIGTFSAVVSCFTGWLLGGTGGYDSTTLQWHQWLGIATATVAAVACFKPKKVYFITLSALLLTATGHLGGTMTHGEGYLLRRNKPEISRPADIQNAPVYAAIIAPIFQEKCLSCHGSTRQKGGLRLDRPDMILKGGKDGGVLTIGDRGDCELLRRCLLPLANEDHMPPKEKPQLTPVELEILKWWVAQGADFQKKTMELPQSEMIRRALMDWQRGPVETTVVTPDVPEGNVSEAPRMLLAQLRQAGLVILPVGRESHWISVSFINLPKPPDSVFVLLEKIAPQVVWLQMSYCEAPESAWQAVGKLTRLTRLSLDHSSVSDQALLSIKNLRALQYLNLAHTAVSENGVRQLADLTALRTIFLFKTAIPSAEWAGIQSVFPKVTLDTGGYRIPFLETDTARLKAKAAY